MEVLAVFKVFPQNRVQQRSPSSTLTFSLEVFKIFTSVRAHQLHPLALRMRLYRGVFALFPGRKKSATLPPRSWSELPPHSSPWTPPAHAVPMGREEEKAKRRQQASETLERARLPLDQASKRRKRKKRRKRRLPKSSSRSSHLRARRRHLQWHVPVWRSSSIFARPECSGAWPVWTRRTVMLRGGRAHCRLRQWLV